MRRNVTWFLMFSCSIAATAFYSESHAWATPPDGFTSTTLVKETIGEDAIINKPIIPNATADDRRAKEWLSQQKIERSSDLYVQSNVWQPGGSTGWHTHPGHSLIIVTQGTLTDYHGNDPHCRPQVYTRNMTFVDPGENHVHNIRNEGDIVARTTAVQVIPAGAARRIDVADPGSCHF